MTKTCRYEGCVAKAHARELCQNHYGQAYRGAPLRPLDLPPDDDLEDHDLVFLGTSPISAEAMWYDLCLDDD